MQEIVSGGTETEVGIEAVRSSETPQRLCLLGIFITHRRVPGDVSQAAQITKHKSAVGGSCEERQSAPSERK